MKRGFKAHAERISSEVRAELKLAADTRLKPLELAEHLSIPVLTLTEVSKLSPKNSFEEYFSSIEPDCFSAITVFQGLKRTIVHNENQHPNRQASNLGHELSHSLLEHEPTPIANADGQRYWDPVVEEEANWLAASLLLPREGVLQMLKSGSTIVDIALHYGVSESLARWRISGSGIAYQAERWRKIWRN